MTTEISFDLCLRRFEEHAAHLQCSVHEGLAHIHAARKWAYGMALEWISILTRADWHNKLLTLLSEGETCDAFANRYFSPLSLIGEDWRELVVAIQGGLTRKQYLIQNAAAFNARRRHKSTQGEDVPVPRPAPEDAPIEERLRNALARCRLLESLVSDLRRQQRADRKAIGILETNLRRLQKIVNSAAEKMMR